ncbi:GNAT family N-acetyltransferase [Comamonas serinivorans]|uniref:GNAT family N-acetyltransferase n=1 Tax=Comamonas serinivorans TaxID=1082851 RepID=A0A1Y0ELA4_9BURK|nr:GNAT family protein [Comamonas serinivorans]ARU04092.1 GNAT family N-acetyltransferase [Comamonas serinivorans]
MHLFPPAHPLLTPRLQLRRFRDTDFAAYAAYHGDPQVYRFLYQAAPEADRLGTQFAEVLRAPFDGDGHALRLAAVRQADEAVVGEVLLKIASLAALQLEVGYIFNPRFGGQGYATEAVRALLNWGFEGMGAHRIFARLDALNTASVKVVERLGMRREAHLIQNDRFNGVWGDEYIHALLRSEWPQVAVCPGQGPAG